MGLQKVIDGLIGKFYRPTVKLTESDEGPDLMEVNLRCRILENFLAELDKAQEDGYAWGFLQKGDRFTKNVEALGKDVENAAGILGGRSIYHLNRLLSPERSVAERDFGESLARFCLSDLSTVRKIGDQQVRKIISSEGADACLWWTLAPYLFSTFRQSKKVSDKEAAVKILIWSKTGKPFHEVIDEHDVNLQGLERYNHASGGKNTFTLGKDPNGNSHRFAKSEANRLAREVPIFR